MSQLVDYEKMRSGGCFVLWVPVSETVGRAIERASWPVQKPAPVIPNGGRDPRGLAGDTPKTVRLCVSMAMKFFSVGSCSMFQSTITTSHLCISDNGTYMYYGVTWYFLMLTNILEACSKWLTFHHKHNQACKKF